MGTDLRRPVFKKKGLCRCGRPPEKSRKLCRRCRYQHRAQNQRRMRILEGKSICIRCGNDKSTRNIKYCDGCAEKTKERHTQWRRQLYREVLSHYGIKCACCGEPNFAFLTLDHINDDGAAHRRLLKMKGGYSFYLWVKRNGYPKMFQVLCWNCQNGKRIYGICPHQSADSQALQQPSPSTAP